MTSRDVLLEMIREYGHSKIMRTISTQIAEVVGEYTDISVETVTLLPYVGAEVKCYSRHGQSGKIYKALTEEGVTITIVSRNTHAINEAGWGCDVLTLLVYLDLNELQERLEKQAKE